VLSILNVTGIIYQEIIHVDQKIYKVTYDEISWLCTEKKFCLIAFGFFLNRSNKVSSPCSSFCMPLILKQKEQGSVMIGKRGSEKGGRTKGVMMDHDGRRERVRGRMEERGCMDEEDKG